MVCTSQPWRKIVSCESTAPANFWFTLECGHRKWNSARVRQRRELVCNECPPQWTRHDTACRKCGTTARGHASHGLCWQCDHHRLRPLGDWSDHAPNRVYDVDDHVFDVWDERAAYLLGVLWADGCLHKRRVKIALGYRDKSWLRQLAKAFKFEGPIKDAADRRNGRVVRMVVISFASKRIDQQLRELGFCVRRNGLPPVPDNVFRHFVRGYFDGDGSVYRDRHANDGLRGNFAGRLLTLTRLRDRLSTEAELVGHQGIHPKPNARASYSLCYAHENTCRLARWMYTDAALWLPRKRIRFGEVLETINHCSIRS